MKSRNSSQVRGPILPPRQATNLRALALALLVVVNALRGTSDWRDVNVVTFWNGEFLRHGDKLGL